MRKVTKRWTMKDGTKIRICDMSNSHLLNTIRMLERLELAASWAEVSSLAHYLGNNPPDGAAMAAEQEVAELADNASPAKFWPIYDDLVLEAERRELLEEGK